MGKIDIKCEAIACWLFMASAVAMAIGAMMLPALVILAIREDRAVAKLGEGDAFAVCLERCEASGIDDNGASGAGRIEWKFRVVTIKADEGDREGNRSGVVYDNASVLAPTHAAMRPGGILNVGNASK